MDALATAIEGRNIWFSRRKEKPNAKPQYNAFTHREGTWVPEEFFWTSHQEVGVCENVGERSL